MTEAVLDRRKPQPLTFAIVGADGSGKTTVIRELLRAAPALRYMYMGASIESANFSLPTSRWLIRRKRRALRGMLADAEAVPPAALMPDDVRQRLPQGRVFKAIGLLNRVAEEWYRQLIVWGYRLRGCPVLCDRHFLFEYFPDSPAGRDPGAAPSVRIHRWLLSRLYPRPDLVIFLDAPPEVLHQRKPEWTLEHLRRQREGILEQGTHTRGFVRVDATQPLPAVVAQVAGYIAAVVNQDRIWPQIASSFKRISDKHVVAEEEWQQRRQPDMGRDPR